jgi:hypothetical protein
VRAYWVLLRVGVVCLLWSSSSSSGWAQSWFGSPYTSVGSVTTVAAPGATTGSNAVNLQVTANNTAGPPTSPNAPTPPGTQTQQGWAKVSLNPSAWVRVEGLIPLASFSSGLPNNGPNLIVDDGTPPSGYLFLGSSFSTSMTTQAETSWPLSLSRANAFDARTAPNTPMRLGLVSSAAGGLPPSSNQALVSNGEPASSGSWSSAAFSSDPITAFGDLYLAGFALSSTSDNIFPYTSFFVGGDFYQVSNQSYTTPTTFGGTIGDPWVLFSGTTVVTGSGSLDIAPDGLRNGVFEFLGDLTVQAGGSVQTASIDTIETLVSTTIVHGPSNVFTGPGTMDLGQILVESANWQLVNATVEAMQGGPSLNGSPLSPWPAVLFYPNTLTTLDAASLLTSPDNMELRTRATLAGLGKVFAGSGFASNGRIQPGQGSQLGTLTFLAGTTLSCDPDSEVFTVVSPSANSQLKLESPPNLGGTLTVSCVHAPGYKAGQVFTVVTAPSFTGNFATVFTPGSVVSAFLRLNYEQTPTQKNMVVSRYAPYISTACTENEKLVAGALDMAWATGCVSNDLIEGLSLTLDSLPLSAFSCGCVWEQVSGLEVLGLLQSGIANASQLTRSVQWELWRAQDGWALSSQGSNGRLWADGSYGQARWTGGEQSLHLHSRGGYGILGGEAQIGQDGVVGVTAHYSPSHQRWDSLESASKLWLAGGGLYAGWTQPDQWWIDGGSWYATASAQFDYLKARLERTPLVAGPLFDNTCTSCLKGSTSGMTTTARLESGYRWNTALLMQPYVALQGTWVHLNAFAEEGQSVDLPLRTWSNSAHESFLSPGFRVSSVWTSPNGHLVTPELVVEVNQALGGRRDHAWVGFEGSPYLVNLQGAELPRTLLFLSGGLQLVWGRHLSGQLRVNWQKGAGFAANGVDLQLAVTF